MQKLGALRGVGACVAMAVAISSPAWGDQAGADALQSDLDAVLLDLQQTLALQVVPASPISVVVDGDGYVIEFAPITVARDPEIPPAGEPGPSDILLSVEGFRLALEPDSLDPDKTQFVIAQMPALDVTVDGLPFATLDSEQLVLAGAWSGELGLPTVIQVDGADLTMSLGFDPLSPYPMHNEQIFTVQIERIAQTGHLIAEGAGLWRMDSKSHASGIVGWLGLVDNQTDGDQIERLGSIDSTSVLTGVPLQTLRDLFVHWAPQLTEPTATLTAEERRQRIVDFVTELPPLFDSLMIDTQLSDVTSGGTHVDRHTQYFSITEATSEGMNIRWVDSAEGIRPVDLESTLPDVGDSAVDAFSLGPELTDLIEILTPVAYGNDIELVDIPIGTAWRDLVATVDVWVDDPDAAAEVFFRSFGNAAMLLESRGIQRTYVEWQDASLDLVADFTAAGYAEMGVFGVVDVGFENMAAMGSALTDKVGPEAGSAWVILQALGQQNGPTDAGHQMTRYILEVSDDGSISLNGIDFGPIVHVVEDALAVFSDSSFPPIMD